MQASDELDDAQVRQMLFDLESAYNEFQRILHSMWTPQPPEYPRDLTGDPLETAVWCQNILQLCPSLYSVDNGYCVHR